MQFNAIIEKDDYGYFAFVPSLKGCVSQGDTMEEALRNIKEAIELYIETLNQDEINSLAKQDYLIAPVEINIAHG
jgi:predicted RNase H-like HicB family nuclease